MTPDGNFVAFAASSKLYVWESQTNLRIYTNSVSTPSFIGISPDGNRLAYAATSLSAADRAANTNWLLAAGLSGGHPGLHFSSDSRYLVYANTTANAAADTNGTLDVYVYDFLTGANILVSQTSSSSATLGGASDWPDISPDGRFVSYRSAATNIVINDTNGSPDVFLYDRLTSINTLLSTSRFGNSSADSRSLSPVFSGNGRVLLFQSWASDLVPQDFNYSSDVFAFGFLYATVVAGNTPGEGPTLSWPAAPGQNYHVQFKNNLKDADWQQVTGNVTVSGNAGQLTDLAPSPGQRFYRVVAD
jgi:hypothetical protein